MIQQRTLKFHSLARKIIHDGLWRLAELLEGATADLSRVLILVRMGEVDTIEILEMEIITLILVIVTEILEAEFARLLVFTTGISEIAPGMSLKRSDEKQEN